MVFMILEHQFQIWHLRHAGILYYLKTNFNPDPKLCLTCDLFGACRLMLQSKSRLSCKYATICTSLQEHTETMTAASAEQASLASLLQEACTACSITAASHEQELCVLRQAAADAAAQVSAAVAERDRTQHELDGQSEILSAARSQVTALQRQGDSDQTTVHEIRRQQVESYGHLW